MAIIYIRNVLNPELSVYWSIFIEEILNVNIFFQTTWLWRNLNWCVSPFFKYMYLRIDRNFCSVHEEITSIRLHTPCDPRSALCKDVYNLIEGIKFSTSFPAVAYSTLISMINDVFLYIFNDFRWEVIITRKFNLWSTIYSVSTTRTMTQKTQYISVFLITFTFEILGIHKSKVPSQGSQTWLKSHMPERRDPYIWYIRRVCRYQRDGHNP